MAKTHLCFWIYLIWEEPICESKYKSAKYMWRCLESGVSCLPLTYQKKGSNLNIYNMPVSLEHWNLWIQSVSRYWTMQDLYCYFPDHHIDCTGTQPVQYYPYNAAKDCKMQIIYWKDEVFLKMCPWYWAKSTFLSLSCHSSGSFN